MSNATLILIIQLGGTIVAIVAGVTAAIKAIKADETAKTVSTQVSAVDNKVDGHLSLMTQAVVNSAVNQTPIDRATVQALVDRSNQLTGAGINVPEPIAVATAPAAAPVAAPIITMPAPPPDDERGVKKP